MPFVLGLLSTGNFTVVLVSGAPCASAAAAAAEDFLLFAILITVF
jgi:hypothetical protein